MRALPSRFRRLDGALADLPVAEPMLLTELDGFLTGLLVCSVPIEQGEWMTVVWGEESGGVPPFDDPLDVHWFATAVAARRDEIARDLARGKLQPILDVDDRGGEVLWEYWIDGFAEAIALRPDDWLALADEPLTAEPWSRLTTLIAIAREESELDSVEINAFEDRAVREMIDAVQLLYAARPSPQTSGSPASTRAAEAKRGRNDPCHCGSGKKHKRCCG